MEYTANTLEERADELNLRWYNGVKNGTLRMCKIRNLAFWDLMLQISHRLEEYEVSARIQKRIDELSN